MDVEVEPVSDIDEVSAPVGVDATEYVLYGGKGGVGKTTMAAATALSSARDGTPTLVVSTDPAHSLADTLDTAVTAEPTQVRTDSPLFAVEIDPEDALSGGFDTDQLFGGNLGDGMLGENAVAHSAGATPGADEIAAIRLLLQYFEDERFERVIVDTAPTGHTLRLLALPEMLDSVTGSLTQLREQLGGLLGGESDPMGDLDGFATRIKQLRTTLRDPERTDFRVVMVPEELSIRETERLLDQLDAFEIPVGTVVVNRVMQDPGEVIDDDIEFVAPNHTDCAFCKRRWEVQQRALANAQDIFRGHEVKRVPLLAEEVRGERLLRVVGACLAA